MQASTKLLFAVFLLLGSYLSAAQRVAWLTGVTFETGTLVPNFKSEWTHYYINVANSFSTLKTTISFTSPTGSTTTASYWNPTSAAAGQTLKDVETATGSGATGTITSGTQFSLTLGVGTNWVVVKPTNSIAGVASSYPAFVDSPGYIFVITRAAASESTDSTATLSWGTGPAGTMSPTSFSTTTYSYTITGATTNPTLAVVATNAGATLQWRGTANNENVDWTNWGSASTTLNNFCTRIYVRVRAAAGSYSIYTINIYKKTGYLATLTASNTGTFTFTDTTLKYSLSASTATTYVSVVAATGGTVAIYADFDGGVDNSNVALSGNVHLRPGVTAVRISNVNTLTRWYTVFITRSTGTGSSVALSALSVANGATTYPLNHAFNANVRYYTSFVSGTAPGSVDITATAADSNAFVSVISGTADFATWSNAVQYSAGGMTATGLTNNKITLTYSSSNVYFVLVRVHAADGSAVRTYTLRIVYDANSQVNFVNSVALGTFTSITPAFNPKVYSYFVVIPNSATSLTITPSTNTLAGSSTAPTLGAGTGCTLSTGVYTVDTTSTTAQAKTCSFAVTNSAFSAPTYRFIVWRAGTTNTGIAELSTAAFTYSLNSVTTTITLSPTFATTTYYYTGSFSSYTIINDPDIAWTFTIPSTLTIGNNFFTKQWAGRSGRTDSQSVSASAFAAGSLTGTLTNKANFGSHLQVRVVSNEGAIVRDYLFYFTNTYVYRAKPALTALIPTAGLLTPTFSTLTRAYTLYLANDDTRVIFNVRAASLAASGTSTTALAIACVNPTFTSDYFKDFSTYWASPTIGAITGYDASTCTITITNGDSGTEAYTVSIQRLKSGFTSTNAEARLSSLEFTGTFANTVTLSPTFSSDVYSYSFTNSYAAGNRFVRFAFKAVDPAATVVVNAVNAYGSLTTPITASTSTDSNNNLDGDMVYTPVDFELNANWNLVIFTVNSADGMNSRNYYVHITDATAQLFNEPRISTLTAGSAVTWTPLYFAPDYYHYNLTTSADKITLNAAPVNSDSALKYKVGWNAPWTPLAASTNTDVSVGYGLTWVYVLSTAPTLRGDITPASRLYTLYVWRTGASSTNSNSYLSAIVPSWNPSALTPAFSSVQQAYTYNVDTIVESVIFSVTAAGSGATVLVSTSTVLGWVPLRGDLTPAFTLQDGRNLVVIRVVASDLSVPRDYHIFINRSPLGFYATNQIWLTGLEVSSGSLSPSFSGSVMQYSLSTDQATLSLTPRSVVSSGDVNTVIRVAGGRSAIHADVVSGSATSVALSTGYNAITVTVTNNAYSAGSNTLNTYVRRTYFLHVFRTNAKGYTNTLVSALSYTTNTGLTHALAPKFNPAQGRYWSVADAAASTISFSITPVDSAATVTVAAIGGSPVTLFPTASVIAGTNTFSLSQGNNVFTVTVTGSDKSTSRPYSLYIAKPAFNSSSINTLAFLATSGPYGLTPRFSPGTVRYTQNVDASFSGLAFAAFASDPWASVRVSKLGTKDFTSGSDYYSGYLDESQVNDIATYTSFGDDGVSVSDSVFSLSYGPNFFRFTVRARDQSYRTYVVNVNRGLPVSSPFLSSVAFSQGTLFPDFKPETTIYNLVLASSPQSTLWVLPQAVGASAAKLNYTSSTLPTWAASTANSTAAATTHNALLSFNLVAGLQQVSIFVTSADGLSSAQYTFLIQFSAGPDATTDLASLSFGTGSVLAESRSSFLPAFSTDVSDFYLNINQWNGDNQLIRFYIAPVKEASTVYYSSGYLNNGMYDRLSANTYNFGMFRTIGNTKNSVSGAVVYDPTDFFAIPFGTSVFNFWVVAASGASRRYTVSIQRTDSPVSVTLIGDYTGPATGLTITQLAILQGSIIGYFDLQPASRLQSFSSSAYYGTLPSAPNGNGTLRAAPLSGMSFSFKVLASPDSDSGNLAQNVGQAASSTTNNPFLDPNSILYQAFKQNSITLLSSSASTDACLANPSLCGSASFSAPLVSLTILLAFALSLLLL